MKNSMKTKKFASTMFALALGLGLAFGINYVSAVGTDGQFHQATSTFPDCPTTNEACNAPINVGGTPQIKNGSLSVNAFTALMDSEFVQNVTFDALAGEVHAGSAATLDQATCVDKLGLLKKCATQPVYSSAATAGKSSDIVMMRLRYNGDGYSGDTWSVENAVTLATGNPNHVDPRVWAGPATRVSPSTYALQVVTNGYYLTPADIVEISLGGGDMSKTGKAHLFTPSEMDNRFTATGPGNNPYIEFSTDSATGRGVYSGVNGDLNPGTTLYITAMTPPVSLTSTYTASGGGPTCVPAHTECGHYGPNGSFACIQVPDSAGCNVQY